MADSVSTETCVACRGTGRDPTYARRDVLCEACRGSGRVADSVSTEAILSPEDEQAILDMTPLELLENVDRFVASHEALRAENKELRRALNEAQKALGLPAGVAAADTPEASRGGFAEASGWTDTQEATCPPHDFGQDRRWERCARCGADNPEEE